MDTVRYGIIGVGNMGSIHCIYLTEGKVQGAVLAAVCDIKEDRMQRIRDEINPDVKCYQDYHDLLKSGEVDAVIIATPHYLHPEIGIAAFEAGIHVLSEKPIGVYTAALPAFHEAARKSGKAFGVMLNQRTELLYQKIREMVRGGELGAPKRFIWIITNWYRTQSYYDSGDWRATYAGEGGGVLLNQCPHNLDMWQWIFGVPDRIRAFASIGKYHDIEVEDEVTAYAEYNNGATAIFVTTTGEFPGTNRLEITGTKGKLVFENNRLMFTKLGCDERDFTTGKVGETGGFDAIPSEEMEITVEGYGKGHRGITQNFTNHILHGEPLLAPGEEGINSLSMSNAMILSSWTDSWVELPNDGVEYEKLLREKIATSRKKENVVETIQDLSGTYGTPAGN